MQHDFYRPASYHKMQGAVTARGKVAAWKHFQSSTSIAAVWDKNGKDKPEASEFATAAFIPYQTPNFRVEYALAHSGVPRAWWRSVEHSSSGFVVETFVDELAAAAGADPVAFRLAQLKDPRGVEVLTRAAMMLSWSPRPSPHRAAEGGDIGEGRGIAYVHYKHRENYVAVGIEVAVIRRSGEIRLKLVVCAHDCGLVINPDALANQLEGNVVQTLSRTLHEEVTFDRARVTSVDWRSYPILTFPELPRIELDIVDRPELPPFGAGEAASAPVPAALANAVFDAVGARIRTVPMTPARVREALQARRA
jgi:CO/xanthine dehydrogenase Mo-binding subunit